MNHLKNKYSKLLNKYFPVIFFIILIIIFFWKVFFLKQIPLPADLVAGAYFPWLDYKWGYDVGVPVKNLITSDVVSVIYPIRSYAVDLMLAGKSVLWNPLMFAGYPLLANFQIALFSPTIIFYFLMPKLLAWSLQVMTQPFLAMLFSYILLRKFKISKLASILGSFVYAFSGFNIIWLEWNTHSLTSAFIPLILYITSRFIEEKRNYWGVLLSLTIALQIFSGYPQIFIYTMGALFLYIIFVYKSSLNLSTIFRLSLFLLLGISLTLIQFLPALELLNSSQRVTENLSYDLVFLPWQNWISFLAPDFYGNHATGNFWGEGNYTNNVGYTGIITLCLAMVSVSFLNKNKHIKYFSILLIISLLLSFPFPWTQYLYSLNLPGIGASSLTRILILTNLSLSFLSAFGLDIINKNIKRLSASSFILLTILFLFSLFSFIQYRNGDVLYLVGLRNIFFPILLISTVFVLSLFKFDFKKYLILGLVIFELFRFGWKYTPFSNQNLVYPDTPVTNFLKENTAFDRIHFGDVIPMNMWSSFGLSSFSGYDAVYPLAIAQYIAAANSDSSQTSPMARHGSFDNFNSKLFDLSNNKYLTVLKRDEKNSPSIGGTVPLKYLSPNLEKVFEDRSVAVLKNKTVSPRIFFVSNWETISDDKKVIDRLLDPKFDLEHLIILSNEFNGFKKSTEYPKYEIANLNYLADKITFDIKTDSNGFLFVSDTYYPGWKSYVDGNEIDIKRANFTFRAIPVLKGNHNILFIYQPESFRIGKLISLTALIVLIIILIYGYKKNR